MRGRVFSGRRAQRPEFGGSPVCPRAPSGRGAMLSYGLNKHGIGDLALGWSSLSEPSSAGRCDVRETGRRIWLS